MDKVGQWAQASSGLQGTGPGPLVGGPGVTGRGAGQNLRSGVCGVIPVARPVLPTVPKEAGATEEQPEVKEALISTFLQG